MCSRACVSPSQNAGSYSARLACVLCYTAVWYPSPGAEIFGPSLGHNLLPTVNCCFLADRIFVKNSDEADSISGNKICEYSPPEIVQTSRELLKCGIKESRDRLRVFYSGSELTL
jgi:hypothetical protein